MLEEEGVAEVLPWNLQAWSEGELFYSGQFPAIQDCLYRQLRASRFLLMGDVDELFVPRAPTSLTGLLDHWFHTVGWSWWCVGGGGGTSCSCPGHRPP